MSLKVYIDTNVFLDSFLKRDGGYSDKVFSFLEGRNVKIYLNDVSIINIAYILKKVFSNIDIKNKIDSIVKNYNIVCADYNIIFNANSSKFEDFEDGVQYFCAKEIDANLIISNNKKDFIISEIDVLTPKEFCLVYVS